MIKTDVVDRFGPLGYQSRPRKMIKVTTRNPKDVKILREFCEQSHYTTHESDIFFKDRFMVDHELSGMSWCIVPKKQYIHHMDIIPQGDRTNAPLRIMAIDYGAARMGLGVWEERGMICGDGLKVREWKDKSSEIS